MPRRQSQRYHQRQHHDSEEEFETPALQAAAQRNIDPLPLAASDDELQSESGLGESADEDFIEDAEQSSDDDKHEDPASDSDSAPEEVSFAKAREAEEKRQQMIKGEIRKVRNEERERRRKRDELFKLQKKEKLMALNKRKLPEELLEELSQQEKKKQKTDQTKEESKEKSVSSEEEEDAEGDEEEEKDNDLSSDSEQEDETESADFLPLTDIQKERVDVVSLQARKGYGTNVAQCVTDFKQAMLYGGRHKRMTSQQARMLKAKRLARR